MANTAGVRGKDDDRKLFVGGLPRMVNEKQIREAFSEYGTVESINVKVDPVTAQPRGFCFIVFSDSSVVESILDKAEKSEVTVLGKKVDPRRVSKTSQPGKFFVGGISTDLTEEKLREYFGQFGKITEIQWPFDKVKNMRKAYCFITLENKENVNEVLRRPKQTINGIELDVKRVKFNPETMWTGAGPYPRGGPRGFHPYFSYSPGYGYDDYGYEDYYAGEGMDPYYDGYTAAYDSYAPQPYPPPSYTHTRAPRGRAPGYARHAPY